MRWFRTKRQHGAHLALIAVLLQLVLTFGHVHAPAAARSFAVQTSQSSDKAPPSHHDGFAGSDCATCALIQLSAISAPSFAPQVPLPWAMGFVTLQQYTQAAPATASQASFQARAPPPA